LGIFARALAAFTLLWAISASSPSLAQCSGQAPAGTVCGNSTATTAPPKFINATVIPGSVVSLPSRAAAIAATIPATVQQVQLEGYTSANDGGQGAIYGRTNQSCNVAYRFQSADGQCWELSNRVVNAGYLGALGNAVNLASSVTGTVGSGAFTVSSGAFTSSDVGKLIGIDGFGSSIIRATQVAAGSGYTNGLQNLTVSGGSCSTAPIIEVAVVGGVPTSWNSTIDPGSCTTQPSNPVSVTGGGGTGATYNLDWASLSGAISAVTDATHITVSTNSSVAKTASARVIYGADQTAALNNALAAANNVALKYGSGQLALCGSYAVLGTSPGGVAVAINANPGLSVNGTACPGSTIYAMGSLAYTALFLAGGTETATQTTFASDALKGAGVLNFTSAAGFSAGDAIAIRSDEVTVGNQRGFLTSIKAIAGTAVTIDPPMPTDVHVAYANSINRVVLANNVSISDLGVDCTAAAGTFMIGVQIFDVSNVNLSFNGNRCNTFNSSAGGLYQVLGGLFQGNVSSSGGGVGSDAALLAFATNLTISFQGLKADGFGIGFDASNYLNLDVKANGANGRVVKFSGSSSNYGDVVASGAPPGFVGFGLSQGSAYNNFNNVNASNSDQCYWSNGTYNINNTVSNLVLANCPQNGIEVAATDTGLQIPNVRRGPNVAGDLILTTDQKIQFPFISGATTLNDCALWTADNQLKDGPCGSLSIGNPISGGTNGNVLNITAGNLGQVSPTTTVNGQGCTLGSTCTVTAAAASIAVGTTTITGGASGNVPFNNAGVLGEKGVSGTGNVLLASGASAANFTATGSFTATGLVTNGDLVNASTTVNGTVCTLGSACTVTGAPSGAAGGDLTGTYPNPTLAAVITAAGPIGSATVTPIITYDAKGRLTTVTSATVTPAVGSITGLGTGVATALGAAVSGSGSLCLTTSCAMTTPNIGAATATSVNKVAITAPGTSATITIANAKTLTVNNSLTFSGTDGTTITTPSTSATMARTDAGQTFTGTQTFSSTIAGSINGNAATVTTNANMTGDVTSVGNATTIATGAVTTAKMAAGARQVAFTSFVSSGTFTTPADSSTSTVYHFRMVGGGGGGGGAANVSASAGGGGAGACVEGTFTGVAASTGITITVGTGGAGGANTG